MIITQFIYGSTSTAKMTPQLAFKISAASVDVCQQLGLTGRVFSNDTQALAITEGAPEVVQRYFQAVVKDVLVETHVLHSSRDIKVREFSDYSVWLNISEPFEETAALRRLTAESLRGAMPEKMSVRLRMMVDAYIKPDLLGL